MARVLSGSNDLEKLSDLCRRSYKEQAVWFLNAFWRDFASAEAERIWAFKHKFDELDLDRRADGSALDELNAHRFLEAFNETMTVRAMRDKLRSTGAIVEDRFKLVPLTHILVFRYDVDWHELVNAPQGSQEELEKAQRIFDEVSAAFREAEARDNEVGVALREAKAAAAELKAQEDAYNNRTRELQHASETGGLVSRNKAKNELAQHLASDPLPLRRAKITQEAALKKVEAAKAAAEAALEEARRKLQEAEEFLEKARNSGIPEGAMWWLERELQEKRAYLPKNKGGYNPREK